MRAPCGSQENELETLDGEPVTATEHPHRHPRHAIAQQ